MYGLDPNATKYMVKAKVNADGIVDKPDVVGAIFGQTEGLLGDDLDLRDLQKSGKIGRIEVEVASKGGKSEGVLTMSTSLDQVETALLAAALETIERVGPCKANVKVLSIEDVRVTKREQIVERAKELLADLVEQAKGTSDDLTKSIRESVQMQDITTFGKERLPAGPSLKDSDAIIIVEGRSDVLNLLRAGIKNTVAVEGTNIPKSVQDLSRERVTTAFVDGDRGGELILRELFQTSEIDYVARAPRAHEVEELSPKQLVKCLRNKVPGDEYMEINGLNYEEKELSEEAEKEIESSEEPDEPAQQDEDDGRRKGRRDRRHRGYEDDGRSRRARNGDRFDADAADRYRKRRDEEEQVAGMTVDTLPAKRKLTEEAPDTEPYVPEKEIPVEIVSAENGETVGATDASDADAAAPAAEEVPKEEPAPAEDKEDSIEEASEAEAEKPAGETEEAPAEAPEAEPEPAAEPEPEEPRKLRPRKSSRKAEKVLTPEQEKLRDILTDITGTKNSVLLDAEGNEVKKVTVKELADYLKGNDVAGVASIVYDGVVSQNLIDIASGKGIPVLVCKRKGRISKLPTDVTVWTREDLV